MINIDFVNDSINLEVEGIFHPFNTFTESCKKDINNMFADFSIMEEKVMLESSIMGSIPESMTVVYESEKKNIFTKIGEMVIAIYNKFVELMDKVIDGIKNYSFKNKSEIQKLDILLKKHPELKDEAITAFKEGALDLSDVRNLKDLDSAFDEILKMARQQTIDPNSIKGKWEKAIKNYDEHLDRLDKTVRTATSVIKAVELAKTFSSTCAKAAKSAQEDKEYMRQKKSEALNILEKAGAISNDSGKYQILLQIWRELNGKHSTARKEHLGLIAKAGNAIAGFVDRFDKDGESKSRLLGDLKNEPENKQKNERNNNIPEQKKPNAYNN